MKLIERSTSMGACVDLSNRRAALYKYTREWNIPRQIYSINPTDSLPLCRCSQSSWPRWMHASYRTWNLASTPTHWAAIFFPSGGRDSHGKMVPVFRAGPSSLKLFFIKSKSSRSCDAGVHRLLPSPFTPCQESSPYLFFGQQCRPQRCYAFES